MKSVIVTGANGFVGNAVVKELSACGYHVYAVVREENNQIKELRTIGNVSVVFCNMNHYDLLPQKIDNKNIVAFYHFAWEGSAGTLRSDERVQLANVQNSCNAVKCAAKIGVKRFIFASSIMEYEVEKLMSTRMAPPLTSQYCTSKIAANYMCRAIANNEKIEYVSGIISNIYGPGEVSPRLINTSIKKLLNGERASFSSGEQLYDFIYITDAARIFALLAEKGSNNGTYYVGSEKPKKLKEFLIELGEAVSCADNIGLGDFAFDGVSLNYDEFDRTAVGKELGYVTQVEFRDGIKMTAEWISEQKGK